MLLDGAENFDSWYELAVLEMQQASAYVLDMVMAVMAYSTAVILI